MRDAACEATTSPFSTRRASKIGARSACSSTDASSPVENWAVRLAPARRALIVANPEVEPDRRCPHLLARDRHRGGDPTVRGSLDPVDPLAGVSGLRAYRSFVSISLFP